MSSSYLEHKAEQLHVSTEEAREILRAENRQQLGIDKPVTYGSKEYEDYQTLHGGMSPFEYTQTPQGQAERNVAISSHPGAQVVTGPAPQQTNIPGGPIETAHGTIYRAENIPAYQILAQEGPIWLARQRVDIALTYAPQELGKAVEHKDVTETKKALALGVERRIEADKTRLLQTSALSDLGLENAGLLSFNLKGTAITDIELTPLGKELVKERGEDWFYNMEQKATWGKSFDFMIGTGGKLTMYPEGTRTALKESGTAEPIFLEKEGKTFLVAQKEGKDTISVMELDPYKNVLNPPQSAQLKDFLDLSEYEVAPDASFDYSIGTGGLDITATGVSKKSASAGFLDFVGTSKVAEAADTPFQFGVGEGAAQIKADATIPVLEGGKVVGTIKWDNPYAGRVVETSSGSALSLQYELEEGKFLVPSEVLGTPEAAFYGPSPVRNFFNTDISYEFVKFIGLPAAERSSGIAQGWPVKPSSVANFIADFPEFIVKSAAAVGVWGAGGVAAATHGDMSSEERYARAGDLYAAWPAVSTFPITVIMVGGAGGAAGVGAKAATEKSLTIAGKSIVEKSASKVINVRMIGDDIVTTFNRGSMTYEMITPKGAAGYTETLFANSFKAGLEKVSVSTGNIMATGAPVTAGIKSGVFLAGAQTAVEFAPAAYEAYFSKEGQKAEVVTGTYSLQESYPKEVRNWWREAGWEGQTARFGYAVEKGISKVEEPSSVRNIVTAGVAGSLWGALGNAYPKAKEFAIKKLENVGALVGEPGRLLKWGTNQVLGNEFSTELTLRDRLGAMKLYAHSEKIVLDVEPGHPFFVETRLTKAKVNPFSYFPQRLRVATAPVKSQAPLLIPGFVNPDMVQRRAAYKTQLNEYLSKPTTQQIFAIPQVSTTEQIKLSTKVAPKTFVDVSQLETPRVELGVTQHERILTLERQRERITQEERLGVRVNLGVLETPRIGLMTGQRGRFRLDVPERPPALIVVPNIPDLTGTEKKKTPKEEPSKLKYGYAASLIGIDFGAPYDPKKVYTGFEIRGVKPMRAATGIIPRGEATKSITTSSVKKGVASLFGVPKKPLKDTEGVIPRGAITGSAAGPLNVKRGLNLGGRFWRPRA